MQHEGFLSPTIRRWRHRQCVRFLPNVTGIRLLDVGCGQGKLIEFLPPDVHYSGTERDEYDVAQLRHKYPRHSFFVRDLEHENIGLGEDTFHVVVLLALLEHLHNGEQVLQDLRNHLKPDGRLIATTPTPWGHRIQRLGSRLGLFSRDAAEEHCTVHDRFSLLKMASRAGYKVLHYARFEGGLNQICVARKGN